MINRTVSSEPARASAPPVRRRSRLVKVGSLPVGDGAPIAIQSMTTTDTTDVAQTVEQTAALIREGCHLVRITAQTTVEAKALKEIKAALLGRGLTAPLAADIHFNPSAALESAEHVEKVRVNPGNFADSKRFAQREYSQAEYQEELG